MANQIQRNFSIGSEWLYYKIYTGHKTADFILTQVIKPITQNLTKLGYIEKWFFIRYADPQNHLRIRFLITDRDKLGIVINLIHDPLYNLMAQDLIWKIQIDTYQRELERYGTNTMELSEMLFYCDSDAIIQFLDAIEGDHGEQLRWLFGLRSIDHLLDCFGYTLEEKIVLIDQLKTIFGMEFGMSRALKKQLDAKYRQEREKIESFMVFTKESEPDYEPLLIILDRKRNRLQSYAKQILKLREKDKLEFTLDNLMGSYIHMLMNRLFKSKNRMNEMVSYDFLYRYYRTAIALNNRIDKTVSSSIN